MLMLYITNNNKFNKCKKIFSARPETYSINREFVVKRNFLQSLPCRCLYIFLRQPRKRYVINVFISFNIVPTMVGMQYVMQLAILLIIIYVRLSNVYLSNICNSTYYYAYYSLIDKMKRNNLFPIKIPFLFLPDDNLFVCIT